MSKEQNPCYNCPRRRVGCHSTCLEYTVWDAERKAKREERRKAEETDRKLTEAQVDRCLKVRKRNHQKKNNRRSFVK